MAENLTPRQRKAIEALMTQGDIAHAAQAAGVSRDSLYRWMKRSTDFRNALREANEETMQGLTRTLTGLGDRAVVVIRQVLDDPDTPHAVRLRAAEVVLSRVLQLREMVDIDARLRALEGREK